MPTNDFKEFATGVGANVIDQATYDAAPWVETGFQAGLAQSAQLNKVWRQSAFVVSVLAQLIMIETDQDVLDDGDEATFMAQLEAMIKQVATGSPARIITSSANFDVDLTDGFIGLNRTAALAATQATIPAGFEPGDSFVIQDLQGNFNAYPVTVVPPAGVIAGAAQWVLNTDRGSGKFTYYGSNIWGVSLG